MSRQLSYFHDHFSLSSLSLITFYLVRTLFSGFLLEPSEAEGLGLADEVLVVERLREPGPGVLGLTSGPNKEKISFGCDESSSFLRDIIIIVMYH